MNEPANDTSFQAGEPSREGSIQSQEPIPVIVPLVRDEASAEGTTVLDAIADRLKPYERWAVIVGVALQMGVLVAMMFKGVFEKVF